MTDLDQAPGSADPSDLCPPAGPTGPAEDCLMEAGDCRAPIGGRDKNRAMTFQPRTLAVRSPDGLACATICPSLMQAKAERIHAWS